MLRGVLRAALAVTLLAAAAGCGGGKKDAGGGDDSRSAAGKQVFVQNCGRCHTLASAGTTGSLGPDLDLVQPNARVVERRVRNGSGSVMPAFKGRLSDEEIAAVAAFVAETADAALLPTDRVFLFNCGGCHQLAAANAFGLEGPNLDELHPSAERVAEKIRTGGKGMPSFAGVLSAEVIEKIADYVAKNAQPSAG